MVAATLSPASHSVKRGLRNGVLESNERNDRADRSPESAVAGNASDAWNLQRRVP
jgi:hypothetical protein